jgi:hypothetical protein
LARTAAAATTTATSVAVAAAVVVGAHLISTDTARSFAVDSGVFFPLGSIRGRASDIAADAVATIVFATPRVDRRVV